MTPTDEMVTPRPPTPPPCLIDFESSEFGKLNSEDLKRIHKEKLKVKVKKGSEDAGESDEEEAEPLRIESSSQADEETESEDETD